MPRYGLRLCLKLIETRLHLLLQMLETCHVGRLNRLKQSQRSFHIRFFSVRYSK